MDKEKINIALLLNDEFLHQAFTQLIDYLTTSTNFSLKKIFILNKDKNLSTNSLYNKFLEYDLSQLSIDQKKHVRKSINDFNILQSSIYVLKNQGELVNQLASCNIDLLLNIDQLTLATEILRKKNLTVLEIETKNCREYPIFWEYYKINRYVSLILKEYSNNTWFEICKVNSILLPLSLSQNIIHYYFKSCYLYIKGLKLYYESKRTDNSTPKQETGAICRQTRIPKKHHIVILTLKLFFRELNKEYYKLFFREKWKAFYKKNGRVTELTNHDNNHWFADPFLFTRDHVNYIFVEDFIVDKNKGVISCFSLIDDTLAYLGKVLECEYHLSFPYVFENNGNIYMIPESKLSNRIDLYQCEDFPLKWMFKKTLIADVKAVDTVVFERDNKWWLYTNIEREGTNSWEDLFLYYSDDLLGNWKPHPQNPIIQDITQARMAGGMMQEQGNLIRPSQDCSIRYGYSYKFNEVTKLTEDDYREKMIMTIKPTRKNSIATHSYNRIENIEVFDVNERIQTKKFNMLVFVKKAREIHYHKLFRQIVIQYISGN